MMADFVPGIGPGDFRKPSENSAAESRSGQYGSEAPRTATASSSQAYTSTQVYSPTHTSSQGYASNQAYSPPDVMADSNLARLLHSSQQNEYTYPSHAQLQAAAQEASIAADSNGDHMNQIQFAAGRPEPKKRLVRACDACSRRKVKCGEEFPCRNCVDLGMECTFERALKRRGPLNRVAAEMKRQKMDGSVDMDPVSTAPPAGASITLIAHFDVVHRMIYDYYTYVYPIFPFPHEDLVLRQLRERKDSEDKSFLVLITSMVAMLATFMPRIARKSLQNGHPDAIDALITRCTQICLKYREPVRLDRDVNEAAISFFLAIITLYRPGHAHEFDVYLRDSLSILQHLKVLKGSDSNPVNNQINKRIFWAIYNTNRSMQQQAAYDDLIPFLRASQLPELPASTDDYHIHADHVHPHSHEGQLSLIEGLNVTSKLYLTYHRLLIIDLLNPDIYTDTDSQDKETKMLPVFLADLDNIWKSTHVDLACSLSPAYFSMDLDRQDASAPITRQHVRWEIQKLCIRVALLSTRFYLTERLLRIIGAENEIVAGERMKIFKELKELFRRATRESVEPVQMVIVPKLEPILSSFREGTWHAAVERDERDYILGKASELFEKAF